MQAKTTPASSKIPNGVHLEDAVNRAHHESTRSSPLRAKISLGLDEESNEAVNDIQDEIHREDARFEAAEDVVEDATKQVRAQVLTVRERMTAWAKEHPYMAVGAGVTVGAGAMMFLPRRGRRLLTVALVPVVVPAAVRFVRRQWSKNEDVSGKENHETNMRTTSNNKSEKNR